MYKPSDGKDWFRPKAYLHFDHRLSEDDRDKVEKIISDPTAVARHAFYPFVRYLQKKHKIVEEPGGKRHYERGYRPICYASHFDAQIFSYYGSQLNQHYEKRLVELGLNKNVIAFRKLVDDKTGERKCNIHLANDAFEAILATGECRVYAFDVKSFFDRLDARELKRKWCDTLGVTALPLDQYAVFKAVTKYGYVNLEELASLLGTPKNPRKQRKLRRICSTDQFRDVVRAKKLIKTGDLGIPQGSPMSAVLANIYMLSFDEAIASALKINGGVYFRYCDDILCIVPSTSHFDVQLLVESELAKIKLALNSSKTDISTFFFKGSKFACDKPIQYLGFIFDGVNKSIRPSSISLYRRSVRMAVELAKKTKAKNDKEALAMNQGTTPIHVKKLFRRYSHVGQRTFITYGQRAHRIMGSPTIRRQLTKLSRFLQREIDEARAESTVD